MRKPVPSLPVLGTDKPPVATAAVAGGGTDAVAVAEHRIVFTPSGLSGTVEHGTTVLEAARRLGATHTVDIETENLAEIVRDISPIGADLVCDASGASSTLEIALKLTRPDGQVSKVGWSPEVITTDVNPLVLGNIRLQGSFSHNYPVWERVIQLLDRGVTLPETIVGLRSPLTGWREAFDSMHDGRVIKSVLLPGAI